MDAFEETVSIFSFNYLFIAYFICRLQSTSFLTIQFHPYKSLPLITLPLLLREGDASLMYHSALGYLVPGRLSISFPTETQPDSPIRGRGSKDRQQSQRQPPTPTPAVRGPTGRPRCTTVMCAVQDFNILPYLKCLNHQFLELLFNTFGSPLTGNS